MPNGTDVNDPIGSTIKNVSEGAAKGILDWGKKNILDSLIKKMKMGDLAFIEDEETINIVNDERKSPQWEILSKIISDKEIKIQFNLGFALQKLECKKEFGKLKGLRNKIAKKYGDKGLHIAEAVQTGIFTKYLGILMGTNYNFEDMKERILPFLENIEQNIIFVKEEDNVDDITARVINNLTTLYPKCFIILSKGDLAQNTAKKIYKKINNNDFVSRNYVIREESNEPIQQLYYFLIRKKEFEIK